MQVIDKNKLRWFGSCHEERGRVNVEGCNEDKDEGKETEKKAKNEMWLDNMDSHLKGKNASLKEVGPTRNEMFREQTILDDIDF